MLDALELIVVLLAVGVSVGLAWRALRELVHGAREAAHGATDASKRLWAYRMRIFTLTGLAAVGLGVLAAVRHDLVGGGAWWLSGGMLAFGLLAWASARASGRASRRRSSKREHVRARLRSLRRRRRQRRAARDAQTGGASQQRRQRAREQPKRESRRQKERRQALRTLGLPQGATDEQIKRAWREQALQHHPDRHVSANGNANGDVDSSASREDHAEAFLRAQRAYETLTERDEQA